jgi:hypothetical protein
MRLSLSIALLCSASIASAANLPKLDIAAYCNATYTEKAEKDKCVDRQQRARGLLSRVIGSVPEVASSKCYNAVSNDGVGSYMDLFACIEDRPEKIGRVVETDNGPREIPSSKPSIPTPADQSRYKDKSHASFVGSEDSSPAETASPPTPPLPTELNQTTGSREIPNSMLAEPPSAGQDQLDKNKGTSSSGSGQTYSADAAPRAAPPLPTPIAQASPLAQVSKFRFDRDLGMGSVGSDVRELQIFLNTNGFRVADEGPGSPGHEVNTFGTSTRAALMKFQKAHMPELLAPLGLKATGFFGSATRNYIDSMK